MLMAFREKDHYNSQWLQAIFGGRNAILEQLAITDPYPLGNTINTEKYIFIHMFIYKSSVIFYIANV